MLKKIVICLLAILPVSIMAQNASELKFGHVNTQELIMQMSQMKDAQTQLEALSKQYEDEIVKMNEELQKKYQDFQALKDVDEAIVKTRQDELMALNQRVELVKQTAQEQIQKKQETLVAPIIELVKKAIAEVGQENGYMYIFDTSVPATVYQSPKSEDVTEKLKKKLNITATPKTTAPAAKK